NRLLVESFEKMLQTLESGVMPDADETDRAAGSTEREMDDILKRREVQHA
ncbi:MAG: hypothetical protein IT388_00515, partial [Nitrospirales bacterium]|nr:hypothetical protein [Nitrospirales bacterium]